MTRVNVVPVTELSQKHLSAEFFEIRRVFTYVKKAKFNNWYPPEYIMGSGHVRFFYNKLNYIADRLLLLCDEVNRRSTGDRLSKEVRKATTIQIITQAKLDIPDQSKWGSYTPTPEALSINRKRISERGGNEIFKHSPVD